MMHSSSVNPSQITLAEVLYEDNNSQHSQGRSVKYAAGLTEADLVDQTLYLPTMKVVLIVTTLALAFCGAILEQTILAVALPEIASAFGQGKLSSWVITSFLLGSVAVSPFIGRFSDIFGRRMVMAFCNLLFFASTLACAFCTSIVQLIIFRAIQGMGSSGITTIGFIVLADICPLADRAKYQGIIDTICASAQAFGPVLGGILVEKCGWRATFWILLPFIAVTGVLEFLLIPAKQMAGDWKVKLRSIDYIGCALSLVATVLLLVGISRGGVEASWKSSEVLALLVLSSFGYVAFVVWEGAFARLPLIPLRLFRIPTVVGGHLTSVAFGAAQFIIVYYIPSWLQIVRGFSAIKSGAVILPYGAGLSIFVCISIILAKFFGLRVGQSLALMHLSL